MFKSKSTELFGELGTTISNWACLENLQYILSSLALVEIKFTPKLVFCKINKCLYLIRIYLEREPVWSIKFPKSEKFCFWVCNTCIKCKIYLLVRAMNFYQEYSNTFLYQPQYLMLYLKYKPLHCHFPFWNQRIML